MSTQIIAIDGAGNQRSLLRELAKDGFTVEFAGSLRQAAHAAPAGAVVVAWPTESDLTTIVADFRGVLRASLVTVIPEGETSFLTAMDLYQAGADDCLTAPVDAALLAGSINTLVSQRSRTADLPRHSSPLLPIEQRILSRLTGHRGQPVTLAHLADQVWGPRRGD